jgi:hypothetical protein
MVLRIRLSDGFAFSVRLFDKVQNKMGLTFARPAGGTLYVIFGGLAIWLCFHNFRPMTLRRCFSAGLRFIGYFSNSSVTQAYAFLLFIFEILPFIIDR